MNINDTTVTVTLRINSPFDIFYRNSENTLSVCSSFIKKYFSITSKSIVIQAKIKNPKKKGWMKVNTKGNYVHLNGKDTHDIIVHRSWRYLDCINFPSIFYIKIYENNI